MNWEEIKSVLFRFSVQLHDCHPQLLHGDGGLAMFRASTEDTKLNKVPIIRLHTESETNFTVTEN